MNDELKELLITNNAYAICNSKVLCDIVSILKKTDYTSERYDFESDVAEQVSKIKQQLNNLK